MKANFTNHVSRFRFHVLCALLFALCLSAGAFAQNGPQAATQPVTHAPEDKDQLALMRLRVQIAEAQNQMRQAKDVYESAQKLSSRAEAEFSALLESTVTKLPPATKGRRWQPADDGRGGYVFVEREDPTATTAAATLPAATKPQEPASQANSSPPKTEKPVSSVQSAKPKGGQQK